MKKIITSCIAAAMCVPNAASARDWPDTAGWTIVEADESCGMMLEYEGSGSTELIIVLNVSGGIGIQLTNEEWSAKKDQDYPVRWLLNGYEFGGQSIGVEESSTRRGFLGKFGADVLPEVRQGKSLKVYLADKLVDQLSLDGSAAALAMTQRCLAALRATRAAEQRETARLAHIPADPFAEALPTPSAAIRMSADNYPPSALREKQQGDVTVKLTVDTTGRAQSCAVQSSSGSAALDDASCRILRSRGGLNGSGAAGEITRKIEWRLPD